MKVNILGTPYDIIVDPEQEGADGRCYLYEKKIKVKPSDKMVDGDDPAEVKKYRFKEVLRHEIVHAFFNESGIDKYCMDEELVDWIAMQFPKMQKAFEDANCL